MNIICNDGTLRVPQESFLISKYLQSMEGDGDYVIPYDRKYVNVLLNIFYSLKRKINLPPLLTIKQLMKLLRLSDFLLIDIEPANDMLVICLKHRVLSKYKLGFKGKTIFNDEEKQILKETKIAEAIENMNETCFEDFNKSEERLISRQLDRLKEIYTLEYFSIESKMLHFKTNAVCFSFTLHSFPFYTSVRIIDNDVLHVWNYSKDQDFYSVADGFAGTVAAYFA